MEILQQLRAGQTTASADATQTLARGLAAVLPPDVTLALHGDLGVGKTTFVQGLASAWGIPGPVTSPTFTIYGIHRGLRQLVHLDAYRLTSPGQIEDLMLEDFLVTPYCLAIEWPERIAGWLPKDTWHFDLGIAPDSRHTIRLRS